MAIYHLEAKVISRGNGRSACAAAAYMSCSRIYNDYDGIQHDYSRKQGLVWSQVFLPENAPPEWQNRSVLWNAVEENEKTKDSRLAREFVVALPAELEPENWKNLLSEYIRSQFVDEGMCADVSIHDTDGHNLHAHILLTVRPLDENGKWQYKTKKEYLCIRDGEERGFTADEWKSAQSEGWEKQYPYKPEKGKKNIYLSPSEAERRGLVRAGKHPKSTKYGRQNPVSERWNSEEQLILWREAWADISNRCLEQAGCEERIDHRSHAERGIAEQPTIHEGVFARNMEADGIASDRCEINRQIRSDNRLLRELKKQMERLAKTVRESVPAVADALEKLRGKMVLLQYNLLHSLGQSQALEDKISSVSPVMEEYKAVKKQIRKKQSEKKKLAGEKSDTGVFSPLRHVRLNQQIAELTEDIGELMTRKKQLMYEVGCHDETEMKLAENTFARMEENMGKLDEQQDRLKERLMESAGRFIETRENIGTERADALLDARASQRQEYRERYLLRLRTDLGQKFDGRRLHRAEDLVDQRNGEEPGEIRERLAELRQEREAERRRERAGKEKKKSHGISL
ncbi:MAG: MobA/MobL family protein [Clostridiales bacterium]|nr:MobA/MobL family protein [Clostridiales bacterium]